MDHAVAPSRNAAKVDGTLRTPRVGIDCTPAIDTIRTMKALGLVCLGLAMVVAACGEDDRNKTREEIVQGICDTERSAACSTPPSEKCEELLLDEWKDGEEHGCGSDFEKLADCISKAPFVCDDSLGTYRAECVSLMNTYEDCNGHGT